MTKNEINIYMYSRTIDAPARNNLDGITQILFDNIDEIDAHFASLGGVPNEFKNMSNDEIVEIYVKGFDFLLNSPEIRSERIPNSQNLYCVAYTVTAVGDTMLGAEDHVLRLVNRSPKIAKATGVLGSAIIAS